jgi:hypothetical protein
MIAISVCLALLSGDSALAQRATADIVGLTSDPSGAPLPGVRLILRNLDTGAEQTATTDSDGNYTFTLLPVGPYSLKAELSGFKAWSASAFRLAIGDRLRQDVRLELGQLDQSVEVTASSPALQSESSSLGSLINERAVQDLPVNGRNFIVLAQLAAGATEGEPTGLPTGTRPDDRRQTSAVSVNAQPTSFNNFLVDGMDNNERFIGTILVKPSIDALVEMKVQTNLYSAEVGRSAGGVINLVTKSGTNLYHGSLFEFLRNEKLDARNFFAPTKPSYKQNQFGGSLGGPIRRNQTFFFGDYEGFRQRQGQAFVSTIPTLAMRQGNFAGVNGIFDPLTTRPDPTRPGVSIRDRFPGDVIPADRIDPVARNLVDLYPQPTTAGLANNFTFTPNREQDNDTFDARVDHRFSDTNTLFARYSFNNTNTVIPPGCPAAANGISPVCDTGRSGTAKQRAQAAQLNDIHVFSPQLVLELKLGFSRYFAYSLPQNYGTKASEQVGLRGVNIDDDSSGLSIISAAGYRQLGDASFIPLLILNNLYQEVGNVTYIRGAHNVKVGGDLRRRQTNPFQSPTARGQFNFDANLTNDPSGSVPGSGNSIASLLLGYSASTTRSKYLVSPGLRNWEVAGYVQDDWRVKPWLTLNVGLRYDYYGPNTEVANRISNVDLVQKQIVIAGQNGVSSSAGVRADWNNFAPRFGFAATITKKTVLRGGYGISFVPNMIASSMALRNPPFVSLYTVTATPLTPLNKLSEGLPAPTPTDPARPTGNLTPVAFDGTTPYVQQYNLTLQQELPGGFVATASYAAALGRKQYIFNGAVNVNQPEPGPGSIQPRRPYYSVWPDVSNISIAAPWYNTSYHALQSSLERRFSGGFTMLATYTWAHAIDDFPTMVNDRKVERGNSFLDVRHRFTLSANYDLPFGRGMTGAPGFLLRGWRINAITILSTGIPFTITNGAARANTGTADRPNFVGDPFSGFTRTVQKWFNTAAFAPQPLYTFGNVGRNTMHVPGRKTLDMSVHREFNMTERARLQFRVEAFNLTNTPQFGVPGGALGTATFGVISDAGLPRNLQLALKLIF